MRIDVRPMSPAALPGTMVAPAAGVWATKWLPTLTTAVATAIAVILVSGFAVVMALS
jgi:hypothetical protein